MQPSDPCVLCPQLYELDGDPKRKEFLDDLFSFMQKRGEAWAVWGTCGGCEGTVEVRSGGPGKGGGKGGGVALPCCGLGESLFLGPHGRTRRCPVAEAWDGVG